MFKKSSEQAESLDQPLLDRPNASDDDLREGENLLPPIATTVGILGVGASKTKGYARVIDADDSERAEEEAKARAERMNKLALEKQQNNQAHFEKDMKDLEERVVREAKERARIEENDRLLALRLQQELGGTQTSASLAMPPTTTMMVTVPVDARGGQMISVQVPGHGNIKIMVPRGLKPGDQFNFKIPTAMAPGTAAPSLVPQRIVQQVVVRVPRGAGPSGSFRVILPTNRVLVVGVPAGVREGDMIRVQYDETSGMPNTDPALNPSNYLNDQQEESIAIQQSMEQVKETDAERAEREAFLSALPEDVRREVLAQETAQKRRLSAFARGEPLAPEQLAAPSTSSEEAPLTQEQIELLSTLPAELRGEVERDMRAENARQAILPQGGQQASPQARPARTPPTPPRNGDADLLDFSSFGSPSSSSAPSGAAAQTSPGGGPSQPALDMFQNLSVRGVSKDAKNSRLQQI